MTINLWPTEDWTLSPLDAHGINADVFAEGLEKTTSKRLPTSSFLVVRNGTLVWEAYGDGYDPNSKHYSASVTKSVLSAVVGIAIEQGHIKDVTQPIGKLVDTDALCEITDVTLQNLLTMQAGYQVENIWQSKNKPQQPITVRPESKPGTTFVYNDNLAHLVSQIVTASSGKTVLKLAEEFLFGPLGVTSPVWPKDIHGITLGHTALEWTARDMARFGYLYLRNGRWEDQQIVPAGWVHESTQKHSEGGFPANHAYGYFWWVEKNTDYNIFFAGGFGEQRIFVIPELDMVIVVTVDVDQGIGGHFYLDDVVLPAVVA